MLGVGTQQISDKMLTTPSSSEEQPLPRSLCRDTRCDGSAYVKRKKRAASMMTSDPAVGC